MGTAEVQATNPSGSSGSAAAVADQHSTAHLPAATSSGQPLMSL